MNCMHENKTCIELRWGRSMGRIVVSGRVLAGHSAHVDLWRCLDCEQELYHDWHTDKYVELNN